MRNVNAAGLVLVIMVLIVPKVRSAEPDFFESEGGVRIAYTLDGPADAPPVLLIHGFSASGSLNWNMPGVTRLLAGKYRVIVLDNRGHGRSDKPTDPADYGEVMMRDAVGLLDHLGIERAHVVGYSMGGMITLKLLARRPERVISAVIGGMGWVRYDPPETPPAAREGMEPFEACRARFYDLGVTPEQLRSIAVPMRVVIGTDDRLLDRVVALLGERPDVPVDYVEGANHTNCIMKPRFRESILEFIDSQADLEKSAEGARGATEAFFRAFNARDVAALRRTMHFPHVRIASGGVKVTERAEEFALDFDAFAKKEGWTRSTLDSVRAVHRSPDKVHLAVSFSRFDGDGKVYAAYQSMWIVTREAGRWGIQARSSFAP